MSEESLDSRDWHELNVVVNAGMPIPRLKTVATGVNTQQQLFGPTMSTQSTLQNPYLPHMNRLAEIH